LQVLAGNGCFLWVDPLKKMELIACWPVFIISGTLNLRSLPVYLSVNFLFFVFGGLFMNRTFVKHLSLCLVLAAGFSAAVSAPGAEAKTKYTITKRVSALTYKVNAGQKSGELTMKEADDLRNKLADVNSKIDKCKANNGGKLSYADENNIEKDLNKISLKAEKKELAKRVNKPN